MGWILLVSLAVGVVVVLELEGNVGNDLKDDRFVKSLKKVVLILTAITLTGSIIWGIWKVSERYIVIPFVDREVEKVLTEQKFGDRLAGIEQRLATLEGRLLSSNKVKKAEAQIAAKLTPNQKTLPVFVDAVDAQEGRIHVRDAQGFSREFSFSNDVKVHEAGKDFSLMQRMTSGNPFEGKVGILVYENKVSTKQPAMARSLTIVPTQ